MDIMDESASPVFVLQADFDVVYSSWTEALDQLRARWVRACMGFTEQLQRISVDLEWGLARVGEQGVAVEIHRQHLLVARERLSALEAELTGVRLVLACACALLLQLCRGVWELQFGAPLHLIADGDVSACIHRSFKTLAGAVPKQKLPALWSVRATAAAKSLRWRSDFTRTPSSAAAAVVLSGRIVPSSVRMARPGRFALKTWRKRRRLVARLARLRILIGEANSELEDLEISPVFLPKHVKKESCVTSPQRFFRALALHAIKRHGQKLLQAQTTRLSVPRLLQWQLRRAWWSLRWSWVWGLRHRTRAPSLRRWSREPCLERATTKSSAAAGAKGS